MLTSSWGAGHDDDAVHRQSLEHVQGHVTGSGRHIHEHIVHVLPQHVAPELLDHAADDGAAPDDGVGLVLQQQVHAHQLDAGAGDDGEDSVLGGGGPAMDTEGLGDGGAGDVGVENGGFKAAALHGNSQHRGDKAFAYAAFAADNADDLFDIAHLIHGRKKALRILAGRTFLAAAGAVVRTIFAHC